MIIKKIIISILLSSLILVTVGIPINANAQGNAENKFSFLNVDPDSIEEREEGLLKVDRGNGMYVFVNSKTEEIVSYIFKDELFGLTSEEQDALILEDIKTLFVTGEDSEEANRIKKNLDITTLNPWSVYLGVAPHSTSNSIFGSITRGQNLAWTLKRDGSGSGTLQLRIGGL